MKGLFKRALAVVFSVLMVISSIPFTTIAVTRDALVPVAAQSSAVTIGNTAQSSNVLSDYAATNTIAVDKASYVVGESIQVTTDVDISKYPDAWVGLFRNDLTPTADKYVYWYGFKGSLKPYGTYDIFAVGNYNAANNSYAQPELYGGTFKVVLFGTNDASTVLSTATFTLADQNSAVNGTESISTTKKEYIYGEALTITASSNTSGAWVGLYTKGAVPTYANGNAISLAYYYVDNYNGAAVVSNNLFVRNDGSNALYGSIPVGEYDLYLITGNNKVGAMTSVKISNATINLDKAEYNYGDNVIVNAKSSTASSGAWVGLYKTTQLGGGHPNNQITSLSWYYLSAYGGRSLAFQDLATNEYGTGLQYPLEAGDYVVYVFGDSGYSQIQAIKNFTVTSDVSAHFSSAEYQVDNLTDGFANGKVAVRLANDSFHMINRADVSLYWADIDGNILRDYTALAKFRVTDLVTVAELYDHTIIPEGAETLKAFVSFNGVEGTQGCVAALPDGCAAFEGLDENILSEFQMVSDLHVTDDVTTGMDGEHHVHDNEHFRMMLDDIAENSKNSQGIFVNGDIANNGLQSEYNYVKSIYNTAYNLSGRKLPPMYVSLGNHDSYPGNINEFISYAQSLGADMETNKPYYAQNVNGYNYIFLGGDNSAYYGLTSAAINSNEAEISEAQLQWLDQQLADNEQNNDGKPVFVMLHQAIADTVAGSIGDQGWDGVVNVDELKAVLNKYNNVILLGGHSHWELNSPQNMYPGSSDIPVAINTASVGYLWSDYNSSPDGYYIPGTQGFYVRVYEDKVVFLGRDFENQKWIPSACYVIYNESVSVKTPSVVLNVDETTDVSSCINNPSNRALTFVTTDKNIVQVNENGIVTATGLGTAEIIVSAEPTDTEVVTREKIKFVVSNETVSEEVESLLTGPLNIGEDFSAYIGYSVDGTEYVLTIPGEGVTTDRANDDYSVSQGFTSTNGMTVYYPEFMQKNNKGFSVRQFWDFERQDDGSYVILNTWTNATHNATDPKVPYALDGGSYSYYKETIPTDDNDVEKALTATRYYYDNPDYTDGEYASYYRWYIYKDSNDNYYLKSQHTGYILSLNEYNDQHWFGELDRLMNTEDMAQAGANLDRIAKQDNIKMSLFDYGKYINNNSYIAKEARKLRETGVNTFDASKNDNILWFNQDAWQAGYVVDGVATLNEADKASDKITVDNIGNPSQYDSTPLMLNSLDASGYPYVNNVTYHDWDRRYGDFENSPAFGSDSGSLKYLFDKDMTYVTGDENDVLTADNYANGYYQSVRYDVGDQFGSGMFKEGSAGGMVYSSYMNAAYFDTSEFYKSGYYQPVKGQRFQLYDYVIRPYYHYYYDENVEYTDSETGTTYNDIYDTLIKSTRLDTFGEDSLFNNRYLRKSLRDYNSYNRNFLPFNYGHNIADKYITGDYTTKSVKDSYVDPVYPDETDTKQRTGYTSTQQDTPNLPAYYNDVYADTLSDNYTNSQETNLWFGMTMEFDFEIANNGKVYDMNGNPQDMVFNFTGDDDVLVYIDNVLVLNVAGTHGAQMATINFATGNIAHPTDESCYPAVGIDTSESSTIKAKFEAAYAEAAQDGSNSILAGTSLNEEMFAGNTFANGTRHTLKFFYLERGGSRSFNDIYFNMETLPSSGFEVEKQVEDAQGNDITGEDNSDYSFVVTGYTSDGEALTSGTYTYDVIDTDTNAVVYANLKVKQGDIISLKGGQKAVFKDLDVYTQYTVTEIIDPCVVKNVRTFLDGTEIGNMPVQQDHMVSCTASSYIPVVENDISNVTFVNTVEMVSVSIKYYDREVVSGMPADMGAEPQVYVHKFYGSDIKFSDETHEKKDTEAMIAEAGNVLASGKFSGVDNILDEYYLWLSQEQALEGMQKIVNLHTGDYYEATPYHTNQYGQVQTDGENWVNISEDGSEITSWMFNRPIEYSVTVYNAANADSADLLPIDGTDRYIAAGSCEVLKGYYNQRFGGIVEDTGDQGVNDSTNYLKSYNIPAINEGKITTSKTAGASGKTLNFLYWAFDAEGKKVASTDIDYCYRLVGDTSLYAVYGEEEVGTGVTVSLNEPDFFSLADENGNSVEYVRLNTVMNPYGYEDNFHIGGDYPEAGDGIKDVAVVYVNVKNDAVDAENISDSQLQQLRDGVQQIVESAQSYGIITGQAVEVTVEKTADSEESLEATEEEVTLIANGFKYKVVAKKDTASDYNENEVYLTTKNRILFTTTFKKSQLSKVHLFAFAAMRVVENGESSWVVSDNYIDYDMSKYIK